MKKNIDCGLNINEENALIIEYHKLLAFYCGLKSAVCLEFVRQRIENSESKYHTLKCMVFNSLYKSKTYYSCNPECRWIFKRYLEKYLEVID